MRARRPFTKSKRQRTTRIDFTKRDLDALLRAQWKDKNSKLKRGKRPGIKIADLIQTSAKRNRGLKLPFLDLWIGILDECISWQISLLTVVYSPKPRKKLTTFNTAVFILLCRIIADSIAIRHLILLGFDNAANAILRSVSEHMELLVAVLDDPSLSKAFRKTRTPAQANEFWNAQLARGGLRRRVTKAWQNFFGPTTVDHADWFARWGRNHYQALSGTTHPSFTGSYFSVVPVKSQYKTENWLGIWGDRSDGSAHTVWVYIKFMLPIVLLHHGFPFQGFDKHFGKKIKYSSQKSLHRHVRLGKQVLAHPDPVIGC